MDTKGHNGKQRDRPRAAEGCRDGRSAKPNDVPGPWEQLTGWLGRWGADTMLAAGALLVSAGIGWIYPPAGLIAAGVLLIAGGVLWARGGDGS